MPVEIMQSMERPSLCELRCEFMCIESVTTNAMVTVVILLRVIFHTNMLRQF